jgi:hypothetical protein
MSDSPVDAAARLEALRRSSTPPTVEEATAEVVAEPDLSADAIRSRLDELRALWRMTVTLRGKADPGSPR